MEALRLWQAHLSRKMSARPAKTQISLGIRPLWSESSLSARRNLGSLATHWAHSEDSDQTGRMPVWSESSLGAHSFCWFCHVVAHLPAIQICCDRIILQQFKCTDTWFGVHFEEKRQHDFMFNKNKQPDGLNLSILTKHLRWSKPNPP